MCVCVTTPRKSVALALCKAFVACGYVYGKGMYHRILVSHVYSMFSVWGGLASDGAMGINDFCHLPSEPCLAPVLEQQEQVLTVALGQPVRLCCGRTERGRHWYKEGSRLASAGRVRGWRGRLEIASFLPEDAGRYLCLARGSMTVLHNLTLLVDGKKIWRGLRVPWERNPSSLGFQMPSFVPE